MNLPSSALWLLVGYGIAIILGSLLGGWLPRWIRITHTRLQLSISFVGGLMIGIAVFHMLPHSLHGLGGDRINEVCFAIILGMMMMFFLLRFFHFHQHVAEDDGEEYDYEMCDADHDHSHDHSHGHSHDHSHDHDHHRHHHEHAGAVGWLGLLFGLGIHTFLDGVALASTVQVELNHGETALGLAGFGVFLAVFLHKPLDSMSLATLMQAQGAKTWQTTLVNFGYACLVPLGAACVVFFGGQPTPFGQSIAAWCLAFSCGVFLCIALSDLLPEMEFHTHHRWALSASLVFGVVVAWAVGFLEPSHLHNVGEGGSHDHSHEGHDHDHPAGNSKASKPTSLKQMIEAVRSLSSNEIESKELIGNLGFPKLKGLVNLEKLSLYNAKLDDSAAATLRTLSGLHLLRREKAKLGDNSGVAIGELVHLEIVNLPDADFSDAALASWSKLSKLKLLRIAGPRLTDEAMKSIAAMKSLRFLHLIDVPITDEGLVHLESMENLESFYLDGGKTTDVGLTRLLKGLPRLHFHRDQQHLSDDPLTDKHL